MSNASWAYVAPTPMDINTSSTSQWNTIPRFPNSTLSSYYGPYPWTTIGGAGTGAGAAGGRICPFSSTSALYHQPPPPYPTPPYYPASSIHPSLSTSAQITSGQAGTETDFAGSFLSGSGESRGVWVKREEEQGQGSTSSSAADRFSNVSLPLGLSDAATGAGLSRADRQQQQKLSPVRLSMLDIKDLSPSQAVFYFGVLAVQALLLPRVQFSQGHGHGDRKWGGTLTMYGHTIVEPNVFDVQSEAKATLCRAALKRLMSQFPEWSVPDEPEDFPARRCTGWNWVEVLQDYCIHNGLRKPQYTQYSTPGCRWRHEVELEGGSFFGLLKKYSDMWESKNAAAHMGLHSMLVYGNGVSYSFPGPFILRRSSESLLAHVPRIPPGGEAAAATSALDGDLVSISPKREAEDRDMSGTAHGDSPKRRKTRCSQGRKETPKKGKNVNLLPLAGSRLPDVEVHFPKEEKKWNLTPGELQGQLKDLASQVDRLEKACTLLSLQPPEIHINRLDGCLVETDGDYTAAAHFQGDPFLTRAGAIGTTTGAQPSKAAAGEACAGKVVAYLIKLVNEDTMLEAEAAAKRDGSGLWRENVGRLYEKKGWLGSLGAAKHD